MRTRSEFSSSARVTRRWSQRYVRLVTATDAITSLIHSSWWFVAPTALMNPNSVCVPTTSTSAPTATASGGNPLSRHRAAAAQASPAVSSCPRAADVASIDVSRKPASGPDTPSQQPKGGSSRTAVLV